MTEGLDLRLVPAAAGAWAAGALAVGGSVRGVLGTAAVLLLATVAAPAVTASRAGARTVRTSGTALVVVAAVLAVLTSTAVQLHQRDQGPLAALVREGAAVTVVGAVRSEPTEVAVAAWGGQGGDGAAAGWGDGEAAARVRVVLEVEEVRGRGEVAGAAAQVVVIGGPEWSDLVVGSTVEARGRLVATGPGDRASALLMAHSVMTRSGPHGLDTVVNRFRSALLEVTDDLPADARGLVPGAAIGDTRRLPPGLAQDMRTTGLTHITAVSGGHFAVLAMTTAGLCALLRLPLRLRVPITAAVMTAFVLLVRPEPSVLRAAAMGGLAMVALLLGRPSRSVPALAGVVVVLLVLDPWLARAYGFVLSVLATAAIVLLAPPLARALARLGRPAHPLRAEPSRRSVRAALVVAVPAAAQAVCGPVLVLLEPVVLAYAVPANVLAAPAMVPATVLGTAATALAPGWPEGAGVLARGAAGATWWIATVARTLAGLPGASAAWPSGAAGAALLGGVTAVLLAVLLRPPRRAAVRVTALLVLVCVLLAPVRHGLLSAVPRGGAPAVWDVVVCDVGQGDSLVLRSGPGSAVVVDVGPDDSAARCLQDLGVERVDLLVLTHPHADHVGGLARVLETTAVAQALVSPVRTPGTTEERVEEMLAGARVPVAHGAVGAQPSSAPTTTPTAPGAGRAEVVDGGVAGDVSWEVLGPRWTSGEHDAGEGSAVNDASVVLLLSTPRVRVLALGDLEPGGQDQLLTRLRATRAAAPAEVVKVAHHGSAHQSAELARWLAPDLALVSAGRENDYGHPAPRTVDLYETVGARVMSTADCGRLVLVAVDGGLRVSSRCSVPP